MSKDKVAKEQLPDPPPGWGEDPLSHFIDVTRHNTFGTFDSLRPMYARVSEIDKAFRSLLDQMDDPPDPLSAFMLLRAHAAYLAATHLALATQTVEVLPGRMPDLRRDL